MKSIFVVISSVEISFSKVGFVLMHEIDIESSMIVIWRNNEG